MVGEALVGWEAQSLRETCPFARWREDCKYGQEEGGAAGRLVCLVDVWAAQRAEPQFAGRAQRPGAPGVGCTRGQVQGLGAGIKGCEMRLWGGKAELKRCT